jgi:L-threonylcarbamoyladenylate synthase
MTRHNQILARKAAAILKRGGTLVYPTETQYALGALATDRHAVRKIFLIKQRPSKKILPIIAGDLVQARSYFIFSKLDLRLAKKFWPGPLSLILKTKSAKIKAALGSDLIAVRVSSNRIAASLARRAGAPIVSTSANISGKAPQRTLRLIKKQFRGSPTQPDFFLGGLRSSSSTPSTIVRTRGGKIEIVREGKIDIRGEM